MPAALANLLYLVAAALFIFALKGLTHPRKAVRGNWMGAFGMLLAIVVTLLIGGIDYRYIAGGIALGALIGWIMAIRVHMTAMPEMVALFNGFGGIASVLVAGGTLMLGVDPALAAAKQNQMLVAIIASGIIGGVTFWGSLVAMFKLRDVKWIPDGQFIPGQTVLNAILLMAAVGVGIVFFMEPDEIWAYWVMALIASVLGILLTSPIGGADMPVVIALLNSYSGLAAAATGFVLDNNMLIVAGSLVGASGVILTTIMCKAMNRSLPNVLFGTMGPSESTPDADDVYAGKIKATSAEEIAMLLDGAQRVVIVPGYGMAVSQAQHAVRDLTQLLESRGVDVEFAIHPVAGRMPGHMNVLLAEVNIPYEKLKEMDEINPAMETSDVTLVLGANDVVNPVSRTDPNSPIAGMPIIDADKSKTVVVIKRSLSPGFAGIPNPLFAADNTLMFFSDGKKAISELIAAIKES